MDDGHAGRGTVRRGTGTRSAEKTDPVAVFSGSGAIALVWLIGISAV